MNDPNPTLDAALAWAAAGASIVPVATDGSKRPAGQWKHWQNQRADPAQIDAWFTRSDYGLGLVCGAVSGNLELLEFEGRAVDAGLPAAMRELCEAHGLGELWATLTGGYMETTPSGGLHLLYRIADGPARPNTKLARRAGDDGAVDVLIETRGEGGFVVVAPSGGTVHPTGRRWDTIVGQAGAVPTITAEQRDDLYAIATLLDQMPAHGVNNPSDKITNSPEYNGGTRPGDDYNTRASWDDILGPHGWTRVRRMGHGWTWRRPGKTDPGISATTGQSSDGADRLYVFTTSTEFESERPYSKFAARALLEHGGDYTEAARQLARDGYGRPATIDRPPVARGHLQAVPAPPSDGTAALTPPPPAPRRPVLRHSDEGNAAALITQHGQHIRYCPDRGRWLTWQNTRWAWEPAGGGDVRELAKTIATDLDPSEKGAERWIQRSLSAVGTTNTLTQAATNRDVVVTLDRLDADPWALNTPAGTVDLRTGTLTPADPAALHTRSTAVTPDPDADPTRWTDFLATTFGGNDELIGYLQRLIGYSATGYIGPHVLPFAHGSGGNGKGVFLEAISTVLGDYATTAPNAFLMARNYSQHETEIARLAGARMVVCSEVNENDRFDEAKVKQLTGGDTLTARFMRQDHFTFRPTHHLWLIGNYRPAVTSGGRSFWRRCRLIPFEHEVPDTERIDDLQGILAGEHGPAILNWIIQGAAAFHRGGLDEPDSITKATADYAHDQDTVLRFVEDVCYRAPANRINTREMCSAYERWCSDAGETPVTAKRLGIELRQRFGVTVERSHGRRYYVGITATEPEDDDEESVTREPEDWWKR